MITPIYRKGLLIKIVDLNKAKRRLTLNIYRKRFKFFWVFSTKVSVTTSIYGHDDIERAVDNVITLYLKDLFPEENVKPVNETSSYDWLIQGLMEVKDEICKR